MEEKNLVAFILKGYWQCMNAPQKLDQGGNHVLVLCASVFSELPTPCSFTIWQVIHKLRKTLVRLRPLLIHVPIAVWTLESLYQYLCNWVYEFYDHQEHSALGQSPFDAYHQGIVQTGSRSSRLIPCDENFRILTLPTTSKGTAKVISNQGVKINHLYYWHNSFRNGSIEKTRVNVRYDPSDAGVAYAYVRGQWVRCISQYYSIFHGRSEREIQLATQELRQQHKQHSQKFIITAKALADFLEGTQATESILMQRLKDGETKNILSTISSHEEIKSESPQKTTSVVSETEFPQSQKPTEIKPYEEFW